MSLKQQLIDYRAGFAPLPVEFINIHETAARDDAARFIAKLGLNIAGMRMIQDGWGDGMRVLEIATFEGRVFRWSDSSGGSWFERCESGGQVLVERAPNAPGYM